MATMLAHHLQLRIPMEQLRVAKLKSHTKLEAH